MFHRHININLFISVTDIGQYKQVRLSLASFSFGAYPREASYSFPHTCLTCKYLSSLKKLSKKSLIALTPDVNNTKLFKLVNDG
jgi:hypothetical protein